MQNLGEELRKNHDTLVQRWYERWRESSHPRLEVGETALKNSLAAQLRLIGEQLRDLRTAENPEQIWKVTERLDHDGHVVTPLTDDELVMRGVAGISLVQSLNAPGGGGGSGGSGGGRDSLAIAAATASASVRKCRSRRLSRSTTSPSMSYGLGSRSEASM